MMAKLSKDKAEWHYDKLLALQYFDYLTLAQKVSIFYHDLEHDILKEITGKKEYYDQFNWLKDNQIKIEHNVKKGYIPKVIIDDIDNIKIWRNESVHENNMPKAKYKSHFHTMAQTINFFSEISIPENISDVLEDKTITRRRPLGQIKRAGKTKTPVENEILSKTINYKNNTIYFKKTNNESFQDFVKKIIEFMFNHSLLSDNEIKLLQTRDYSKETFGIEFPLLQNDENKITFEGHCRYWKKNKFGGIYYCCSQWWLGKISEYEPLFANWMNKVFNDNKIN
jgi:hypothetical protein